MDRHSYRKAQHAFVPILCLLGFCVPLFQHHFADGRHLNTDHFMASLLDWTKDVGYLANPLERRTNK